MNRRFAGIVALAGAVALTALVGTAFQGAVAQERDEDERAERQERVERERWRVERRPMAEHARVLEWRGVMGGARLGVAIAEVDGEAVERLRLPEERGARVTEVLEESPAAEAGLREDDVIVRWNDQRVESVAQLRRYVAETPAGRTVRLGVVREGRERTVEVELAEREAPRALMLRPGMDEERMRVRMRDVGRQLERARFLSAQRPRLGIGIQSLTPQLADYFGVEGEGGALVTSVREGSAAERAGLRAGDVIVGIAGERVESPRDVTRHVRGRDPGPVEIRVVRERQERTLNLELEPVEEAEGTSWYFSPEGSFELGPMRLEGFRTEPLELEFEAIELPELGVERFEIPALRIPALEFPTIELPAIEVPMPVAPRRAPRAERVV